MRTLFTPFLIALGISCVAQKNLMNYSVDLTRNTDTIFVELKPKAKLTSDNRVFQFAATAPGTYQTMNIGRYVSLFSAKDKKGNEIPVNRLSINQFEISEPEDVSSISYRVAETFDTGVDSFPIYLMCGTSLEKDHALINAHDILGYFSGHQQSPIELEVTYNPDWIVGTALEQKKTTFYANNFDHAVDSPILMGELTVADTLIANTPITIYTYSKNDTFNSQMLLASMADMLDAARRFLVDLPVDRYTFLYHFEPDQPGQTGAWEHSYSSEYVMGEKEATPLYVSQITDIASHEFFHIVTPLNIHSELIESFNFVSPTPSVHLWLYEGVTEWASNMLLYRGGVTTLDEYLNVGIIQKLYVSEKLYDDSWSLKKLADESFNETGAKQYSNIYMKGSLVAGLLDIRLLELSSGKYGLRELMLDLIQKYGKGKPFSEETFFDDIAAMTYPEIRTFFDQYVLRSEPLPYKEYLAKLGLKLSFNAKGVAVISKMDKLSDSQKTLFEAWSKNL